MSEWGVAYAEHNSSAQLTRWMVSSCHMTWSVLALDGHLLTNQPGTDVQWQRNNLGTWCSTVVFEKSAHGLSCLQFLMKNCCCIVILRYCTWQLCCLLLAECSGLHVSVQVVFGCTENKSGGQLLYIWVCAYCRLYIGALHPLALRTDLFVVSCRLKTCLLWCLSPEENESPHICLPVKKMRRLRWAAPFYSSSTAFPERPTKRGNPPVHTRPMSWQSVVSPTRTECSQLFSLATLYHFLDILGHLFPSLSCGAHSGSCACSVSARLISAKCVSIGIPITKAIGTIPRCEVRTVVVRKRRTCEVTVPQLQ